MNAERLLAHFDRLAEAPDAVPRLRRFVLKLAVRGKLVEQDPTDEPVHSVSSERPVEAQFPTPASWEWDSIADLAHLEMGQSPPSEHYNQSGEGIPFFQGKADFGLRHPTPRYWCTQPTKVAETGRADASKCP